MKIHRFDAHDRLLQFKQQADLISKGCQECIDNVPDGVKVPFYVFMHARTVGLDEKISIFNQDLMNPPNFRRYRCLDEIPEKRLIFMPMARRPKAQSNSMLFRANKGSQDVEVVWQIPPPELWKQYLKGKLFESQFICECIEAFKNNRSLLEDDPDPLTIEEADHFRMTIKEAAQAKNK